MDLPSESDKKFYERLDAMFSSLLDGNGCHVKWFFCFGTMEEYLCDKTFGMKFDVDVGLFYEEYDEKQLASNAEGFGFKVESVLLHDVDNKPLNMHLRIVGDWPEHTPEIDVFAWIRKGNLRYHTYDVNREGKKIPSEYVFKGVRAEWLEPDKDDVEKIRSSAPEMDRMLGADGIWRYDLWEDHGGLQVRIPYAYGSLLDCWDPGWRFRDVRRGQSKSPWIKTVKSCSKL